MAIFEAGVTISKSSFWVSMLVFGGCKYFGFDKLVLTKPSWIQVLSKIRSHNKSSQFSDHYIIIIREHSYIRGLWEVIAYLSLLLVPAVTGTIRHVFFQGPRGMFQQKNQALKGGGYFSYVLIGMYDTYVYI